MNGDVYLLLIGADLQSPDVIYSRDTDLRIKVYQLGKMTYLPNENEIQLYGALNEKLIVFETVDIVPEDALEVISAIRWYTDYIGYPEMEILPEDPRILQQIAIAL